MPKSECSPEGMNELRHCQEGFAKAKKELSALSIFLQKLLEVIKLFCQATHSPSEELDIFYKVVM
jgi:hypothetical protein